MTGFVGERTNRRVALVTDDFKVYHELAPFFEAHGVQLLGLRSHDEVPPSVAVLIDGPASDPRSMARRPDAESTWIRAMARLDGRPLRRAVVGIDPGDTTGMALVVDGWVYWWVEVYDAEAVAARVAAWMGALEPDSWHVHVGDGARKAAIEILGMLRRHGLPAELVPERGSTPVRAETTSRHTDAAIAIAMRQP